MPISRSVTSLRRGGGELRRGDWPLSISGRRLVKPSGATFPIFGDTPWSLAVQCSTTQIDTYLAARVAQGFNTIMFNMIEHYFSSQTPFYEDVDGNIPFTGMDHDTVDWEAEVETYWARVDYIVDKAKELGVLVVAFPAYLGFGGGANNANDQGWDSAVDASTDGKLQAYGAWLATRYNQGNVVWAMGGDYNAPNPEKQWNISTGIRSVNPSAIITYHGGRGTSGYTVASGQTGFNLNSIYCAVDGVSYDDAATEYARSGPLPFFLIEGGYGGAETDAVCRRQTYQAICAGACGAMYGAYPVWGMGEPNANGGAGPQDAIDNHLTDTAAVEFSYAVDLFTTYDIGLLVPKTDTSLVSSSLSSGTSRVCPALASDGTFALIYVPSSQTVTVVMTNFAPSSVRVRLFDPTAGTYATASGSPFANTGSQNIAIGGERVIVLDAA